MSNLDEIEIDGITYGLGGLTIDLEDSNFGDPNQVNADTLGGRPASDYLLKSEVYPVGSIYISLNSTNPSTIFGGTWEQIQGRFLLGVSSSHPVNQTGGEENHRLIINEMPSHYHQSLFPNKNNQNNRTTSSGAVLPTVEWENNAGVGVASDFSANVDLIPPSCYTGGNQPHNNMPPYLAVYMWKRTA